MSIDGFFVTALCHELSKSIVGSRIDKISMPDRLQAVISTRGGGVAHHVLVSAHPQYARVHLTGLNPENPQTPPVFCMVLRKHLLGGKIVSVEQPGSERILTIRVEFRDEYGRSTLKDLLLEMMGKHSNLVLLDTDTSVIIDCAKHIGSRVNRYREILPGRQYILPPSQRKIDLRLKTGLCPDDIRHALASNRSQQPAKKCLVDMFQGLGPLTATEILHRSGVDPDTGLDKISSSELMRISQVLFDVIVDLRQGNYLPVAYGRTERGSLELKAFSFMRLTHLAKQGYIEQTFPTLGELLDHSLAIKEQNAKISSLKSELASIVAAYIQRSEEKLSSLRASLKKSEDADELKLKADLLMTHPARSEKGHTSLEIVNYFDPELSKIQIELDPSLSIIENAQRYYKQYTKAKRSKEVVKSLIDSTEADLAYLRQVESSIDSSSTLTELEEIRSELEDQGIAKRKPARKVHPRSLREKSAPAEFVSKDGVRILVGRNNRQNDELTLKIASPGDIWLHVKDIPGSHVIIRSHGMKTVPETTLTAAALLAAYYSKARESSHVPVDYTLKKHVRKPQGSKPGMVIYDSQTTVYVTPQRDVILNYLSEGSELL